MDPRLRLQKVQGRILKIGVIGGSSINRRTYELAYEVGKQIAAHQALLVCGGLSGVMEAACKGAKDAGGVTMGILPTIEEENANPYVDIIVPTPIGYARNAIVVTASHGIIAIDGSYGTLSEIGYALAYGKPLIALSTWQIKPFDADLEPKMVQAQDAREAVETAVREAVKRL